MGKIRKYSEILIHQPSIYRAPEEAGKSGFYCNTNLIVEGNAHGRCGLIRDGALLEHHRSLILQGPGRADKVVDLPSPEEKLLQESTNQQLAVNPVRTVRPERLSIQLRNMF